MEQDLKAMVPRQEEDVDSASPQVSRSKVRVGDRVPAVWGCDVRPNSLIMVSCVVTGEEGGEDAWRKRSLYCCCCGSSPHARGEEPYFIESLKNVFKKRYL